jgi:hypothetical protein
MKHHLLANGERCSLVINAESKQLHGCVEAL